MKFTNKGRQPKDNSRRTGAGADRVKARQQGALNRFSILPFDKWARTFGKATENNQRASYDAYVARRNVELDSLKRSLNAA